MTSNAPLPPQQFGISFSGGWVGDGSQPAACSSSVTVSSGDACKLWQTLACFVPFCTDLTA